MNLVLGSSSPRRREILSLICHTPFDILHPDIDESQYRNEAPAEHCLRLARSKAEECLKSVENDTLVICADTIVAMGSRIYGKPENLDQATSFLKDLEGKAHQVLSGFAIGAHHISPRIICGICETTVTFKQLSAEQINSYLSSIHYMDKAGAYAIQENGSQIIKTIDGSLSNVVGFPVRLFFQLLSSSNLLGELYITKDG